MGLSEVIKRARRDKGKTQADLASLLNVTTQYISRVGRAFFCPKYQLIS